MKIFNLSTLGLLCLLAISACTKDDKPEPADLSSDGFYVVGNATAYNACNANSKMLAGKNAALGGAVTPGLWERYVALEAGSTFTITKIEQGQRTDYGSDNLQSIDIENENSEVYTTILSGIYTANKTLTVQESGLYHVVVYEPEFKVLIIPVVWGIMDSGSQNQLLPGVFSRNEVRFSAQNVALAARSFDIVNLKGTMDWINTEETIKINRQVGGSMDSLVIGGGNISSPGEARYDISIIWNHQSGMSGTLQFAADLIENGLYVAGQAVSVPLGDVGVKMQRLKNQANNNAEVQGYWESYIAVQGQSNFSIIRMNNGTQTSYGNTSLNIVHVNGSNGQINSVIMTGDLIEGQTLGFLSSGLYHIICDEENRKIWVIRVEWGVENSLGTDSPITQSAFSKTEITYQGLQIPVAGNTFVIRNSNGNSMWLDNTGSITVNTYLGGTLDSLFNGGAAIPNAQPGRYTINLTWSSAAGFSASMNYANPLWENGLYITGTATGYTSLDERAMMYQGRVEGEGFQSFVRTGMFEKMMYLSAGTFQIAEAEGENVSFYGWNSVGGVTYYPTGSDDVQSEVTKGVYMTNGSPITIPNSGFYHVVLDKSTSQIFVTKVNRFGLIGDATELSWSSQYDMWPTTQGFGSCEWTATQVILRERGGFKFRYNQGWRITTDDFVILANIGKDYTSNDFIMGGMAFPYQNPEGIYTVKLTWNLNIGWSFTTIKTGDVDPTPQFPEHLYIIGNGVGTWDWNETDLPMIPVHSKPHLFWKIVWMNAEGAYKFAPQRQWANDFGVTGAPDQNGIVGFGDNNGQVPGTAGYYMVVVNFETRQIAVVNPKVYLIGATVGGDEAWSTANAGVLFSVDNTNEVVTLTKTLLAGELRMYAWFDAAAWFTDWWQSEFMVLNNVLEFRGTGGDQERVNVNDGSYKIDLNFKTGAGSITAQ
jgi:hypothetical protein